MPSDIVIRQFIKCYSPSAPLRYSGPSTYWQEAFGHCKPRKIRSYGDFCKEVARPLCPVFFNISKESLGLRLHKLGLVWSKNGEQLLYRRPKPKNMKCIDFQNLFQIR